MRDLVKAAQALSDETRLRILNLVMQREVCVCEVMQALNISQTRASRNLSILYDAGFFKQRKEGLWSLYSLKENLPEHLAKIVEAVKEALAENKTARADRERLQLAIRSGMACLPNSAEACLRNMKAS